MKKLLALDLDGTLLNSDNVVSDENIKWLKKAMDYAYILLVSTRTYKSIKLIADSIGLKDCYIVGMAGCDIRKYPEGKTIYSSCIDKSDVKAMLDFAQKYNFYIQLFDINGEYYFKEKTEYSDLYSDFQGYSGKKLNTDEEYLLNVGKIMFITENERVLELNTLLKENTNENLRSEKVWDFIIEVYSSSINKGEAVKQIAKELKIEKENIISMGDEEVDISMFNVSGKGIAVKNASDEVKKYADLVTVSNDENAVAVVIRDYIIENI